MAVEADAKTARAAAEAKAVIATAKATVAVAVARNSLCAQRRSLTGRFVRQSVLRIRVRSECPIHCGGADPRPHDYGGLFQPMLG
jgi:hypothetical protein